MTMTQIGVGARFLLLIALMLGALPLLMLWNVRVPLLRSAARLWVVFDRLESADAVAILGGGLDTRPAAAARLYKLGLAPRILVAEDESRQLLLSFGVPSDVIVEFGNELSSTYEEARALADWAERSGMTRVIVPTEMLQSRRVRWILRHELAKSGIRAVIETLHPLNYDPDNWWQHERGIADFRSELIKYLYYRIRY